ncbi:MAG: cysteine peptidase family C39 domain-containing protein, partial [Prevotella sp.]
MILIRQRDSMQCGIACLAMVCRYYGRKYSLDAISRFCFATNEGVSLLGISQAAGCLGFRAVCGRIATEQLTDTALPCILHWNQNHFVVLYKVAHDGRKYYVADPGKGKVRYSKEEFERHWVSMHSDGENKGIAMFLTPTDGSCDHHGEHKEKRKLFRFLWSYVME